MSSSVSRSVVCRLSVCLSSVTLVRPTQASEIFGNVSMPCGILAIRDLCIKILRRSSQGNPSGGGLNRRGAAKYSDFGPIERIISPNSVAFEKNYVKMVEDTHILSAVEM